jgi:hypothetical protein
MARNARYDSPAAKQAAYRERKRLEELGLSLPPEVEPEPAIAARTSEELARRAAAAPDLEAYVANEVAVTRRQLELGEKVGARERPADAAGVDPAGLLERTERYARWRYAGWLAGEIDSL